MKEWQKKATPDKTLARFKQVFAEEYHDIMEETKANNGDAGFHSAKAMQDIRGALEHLAIAAGANKDIVPNMTEEVEQQIINNASLTTQLSNTMKLSRQMAKKLNLMDTQAQDPEKK